jgi:predicted esterase
MPEEAFKSAAYAELCRVETLRLAYDRVRVEFSGDPLQAPVSGAAGAQETDGLLRQLRDDLLAKEYRPGALTSPAADDAEAAQVIPLRDRIVQAALAIVFGRSLPAGLARGPELDSAADWVAGTLGRGLTRVYAIDVTECFRVCPDDAILKAVARSVADPGLLQLLAIVLAAPNPPVAPRCGPLAPCLAAFLYRDADRTLGQLRVLGRVETTRLGHELIVLLNGDPRHDWVLGATQDRLRGDFTALDYNLTAAIIQSADLSEGGLLRVFGYELQVTDQLGRLQVEQEYVGDLAPRAAPAAHRRKRRPARPSQASNGTPGGRVWAKIRLPLWWLWVVASFPFWLLFKATAKIHSVKLNWHTFVLTVTALWAGLKYLRRRWVDVATGACGLAALVLLFFVARDLYAHASGETRAAQKPRGFYLGQYNEDSPWGEKLVHYGLYVPPHFEGQSGPFPMIVFLHGYGERTTDRIFEAGLPGAIALHFGEGRKNGRFEFIALFPIDPTGRWQAGSVESEDAMKVVDHVITRHRIDPERVYLTGLSNGGSGVWRLAEAYPKKWAAIAPISSFDRPEVSNVQHIPAWIFHGGKDDKAPVEPNRKLVQQLKTAGADVRYTEIPLAGHGIWHQTYNSKELYTWFASKKKN